jgi:hypothetical protein
MKHHQFVPLVRIGSTIVLVAMTSCAQLPSSTAIVSAMRCPAHPEIQFLDPEKFDRETLNGGCHHGAPASDYANYPTIGPDRYGAD